VRTEIGRFTSETIGQKPVIDNKEPPLRRPRTPEDQAPRMSQLLQKIAPIGEARDRELLKNATTRVYRETDQGDVCAHVFFPPEGSGAPAEGRPAMIFFHGGFWDVAMPTQFVPH